MGFFKDFFGLGKGDSVRIEGRQSKSHTHKDGTKGHDVYAAKVVYRDGVKVHESNAGFGHITVREDGSKTDNVK